MQPIFANFFLCFSVFFRFEASGSEREFLLWILTNKSGEILTKSAEESAKSPKKAVCFR